MMRNDIAFCAGPRSLLAVLITSISDLERGILSAGELREVAEEVEDRLARIDRGEALGLEADDDDDDDDY